MKGLAEPLLRVVQAAANLARRRHQQAVHAPGDSIKARIQILSHTLGGSIAKGLD